MNEPIPDVRLHNLENEYGAIVGGIKLAKLLGYHSTAALRQAVIRNQLSIKTFTIPHRRGRFAYTRDIAMWLASLSQSNSIQELD